MSRRRLWCFRGLAVLVGPVLFLLLLEVVLTVLGVGYETSFFVPSEQEGMLTTNLRFGWHYQQEAMTEPYPCLLPVEKAEDAIRIFVLGESAAMGTPDPAFGFVRILEFMLTRLYPDHRLEVVNAAMRGINSHVLKSIAREAAGLNPDLFVLYMGNNELNGLYAPKTPAAFFGRHRALIPTFHRLKQARTGQLLRRVFGANPEAIQKKKRTATAEFFREHRTARDDPAREYIYSNFRHNLGAICRYALDGGAGVVISTVAVNLRDCPPLGSVHRSDLTAASAKRWNELYDRGIACEDRGDLSEAIAMYERAAALDDQYADLHFRLARCHLGAGMIEEARRDYATARDWDALQLRADSQLNRIIRNAAAELAPEGVYLVETDMAMAASDRCPTGIPGAEFFYEHVHLRFDGDFETAKALLPAVIEGLRRRGLSPSESARVPSREECAQRLAFTEWDEVNTAAGMLHLTANAPFTEQLEHDRRQAEAQKAVSDVMDRVDEEFVNRVILAYEQAITSYPDDWTLRFNLGTFLHQLGRFSEAAGHLHHVVRTLPHVPAFRTLLGYALGKSGQVDPAIQQFREALKRDARYQEARKGLTWARGLRSG